MTQIDRKTESLVDVLSSCGGLMRALTVIIGIIVSPYNKHALNSLITLNLVRYVPSTSSKILDKHNNKKSRKEEFIKKYVA